MALEYLHTKQIIHRDIKPENLLLDDYLDIKLGDFGWSSYEQKSKKRQTYCGTVDYIAPEMADRKHKHNHKVDIWSIGVLIYELLTGKAPFSPEFTKDLKMGQIERTTKQNIISLNYEFPDDFPMLAKDLVKKILVLNPKNRYTLKEIVRHPWIAQFKFSSKNSAHRDSSDFESFINQTIKESMKPRLGNKGADGDSKYSKLTNGAIKELTRRPPKKMSKYFTPDELERCIKPESVVGNAKLRSKFLDPNSKGGGVLGNQNVSGDLLALNKRFMMGSNAQNSKRLR